MIKYVHLQRELIATQTVETQSLYNAQCVQWRSYMRQHKLLPTKGGQVQDVDMGQFVTKVDVVADWNVTALPDAVVCYSIYCVS